MMLYCIKSYHGKEWYEIGITLVILKTIGYNKADTFSPIISAWVPRFGPLMQSLQEQKNPLHRSASFCCLFVNGLGGNVAVATCMHIFSYAEWVSQQVCIWSSHAYRQLFHKVVNCDHTKDMLFLLPLQPCNKNLVCNCTYKISVWTENLLSSGWIFFFLVDDGS